MRSTAYALIESITAFQDPLSSSLKRQFIPRRLEKSELTLAAAKGSGKMILYGGK